jgi:hypothetical protein
MCDPGFSKPPGPPPVCVDDPSFSMEVIDLNNPNGWELEDPYVLLGCKAIFDPDTGPVLETCTQELEYNQSSDTCYRCCASCRADCLQHFEANPQTLGVYHANSAYLAYLHPAQAVEDHARPCEACAPGSFKRTQADEACSTCLADHFCPAGSEREGRRARQVLRAHGCCCAR